MNWPTGREEAKQLVLPDLHARDMSTLWRKSLCNLFLETHGKIEKDKL